MSYPKIEPIEETSDQEKYMKMWFELKRQLIELDDYSSVQLTVIFRKMREIEVSAFTNPIYRIEENNE
jgi:hypothetical protein